MQVTGTSMQGEPGGFGWHPPGVGSPQSAPASATAAAAANTAGTEEWLTWHVLTPSAQQFSGKVA